MKALETEGFNAATQKLESMTNKTQIAAQTGRLIEGTVAQYELPHGPHAMIETQRAFCLVPWENHHAQKWGKRIKGRVLSGGGIDWDARNWTVTKVNGTEDNMSVSLVRRF